MNNSQSDVIVIGAGPAGCSAAYDLAKFGFSVTLLDKSNFPRVKPCAGGITIKSLLALRYSISPIIKRVCFDFAAGWSVDHIKLFRSKYPIAAMTVRSEFDSFCLNKCLECGVRFHQISKIIEINKTNHIWIVKTNESEFRGSYLIGADGANSVVRRMLSLGDHVKSGVALEANVQVDASEHFNMEMDFGDIDHGYAWIFPKGDHLNVGIYSLKKIKSAKKRLLEFCHKRLNISLDEKMIIGHTIPYNGHHFLHTPGQAILVGDAAGIIDPVLGEGIYNAIRSGQIAANAIKEMHAGKPDQYNEMIKEIKYDLRSYWFETNRFYRNISRGYQILNRWPVRYIFMKGYALGMTIRRIKRNILLLPFLKPNVNKPQPNRNDLTLKQRDASHQASESS